MLIGVIIRHRTAKRAHDAPPPPPPTAGDVTPGGEIVPAPPPEKKPREAISSSSEKHRGKRKHGGAAAAKAELSEKFSADSIVKQYANAEAKPLEEDEEAYNPEDDTPWVMPQSSAEEDEEDEGGSKEAEEKEESDKSAAAAVVESSLETDEIIEKIVNTSDPEVSLLFPLIRHLLIG